MRVFFIYRVWFLRYFSIQAITLYPFILFVDAADKITPTLYRHEIEHIYQVQREGWIQFYFTYLKYYLKYRRRGMSHQQAYWNIPYEMDARMNESKKLSQSEMNLIKIGRA